MEIWGFCRPCDRWFYCAEWFNKAAAQPTCPVCGLEPEAIVNRAAVGDDSVTSDESMDSTR